MLPSRTWSASRSQWNLVCLKSNQRLRVPARAIEYKVLPARSGTYLDEKTHQVPEGYNNWEREIVGMINPSLVKGVKLLLLLAKRLPHVRFAVWLSWGFEEEIRTQLEALPNIE
jgi:hypothetical protein